MLPALGAALAMFLFGGAGAAHAQTTQVLVSNIGQAQDSISAIRSWDHAQGFTTGSNSAGYTLTSIEVQITTSGRIGSAVVRKTDPNTGDLVAHPDRANPLYPSRG